MTGFTRSLTYLLVFALVCVGAGVFVYSAITRPVEGTAYHAEFSDVAGLRPGNDVRLMGVRVGKVTDVSLGRSERGSVAMVGFTLDDNQKVYADSKLAIRYLNLTGIRYVDLQQKSASGAVVPASQTIGLANTVPSFDITTVFHGLAPVFAAMSPTDINHFSESMLALVEGDGTGFPKMLDSLTTVLSAVDNRQAAVNTIVDNLAKVASAVDGKAQYLNPVIEYLSRFGTVLAQAKPNMRRMADTTGVVTEQVNLLLRSIGLELNDTPDLNSIVRQIVPFLQAGVGLLALTPGLLQAVNTVMPDPRAGVKMTCSKGEALLPADVNFFLRGSKVLLCKR